MQVKLLVRNKIDGEAGEIVEVSPDRAAFLLGCEAAVPVKNAREQADKPELKAKEEPRVLKKTAKKK